jgi:hypothetical protein
MVCCAAAMTLCKVPGPSMPHGRLLSSAATRLKRRALRGRQGILASSAAIFANGIERDYERAKAVAKAMAERDPEVRMH